LGQPSPDFIRDIEPILSANCYACHGDEVQENGLRLDNRADALRGSLAGPVIKPGDSAGSKLVQMVAGLDPDLEIMPPADEPLSDAEIGLIRAWIDDGAKWPPAQSPQHSAKVRHWAFQAPQRPAAPIVYGSSWPRNPIDAFVLARLESADLLPSPEATRENLIRRVTLDLVGLPPTPREVDEFVADTRSDAYERVVDRLLASPHYGERWARQWLDLAHYADSDGYNQDQYRPYAWRWRDWVVAALNANMPFDDFTIQQLAGDLLPEATTDSRIATGFLRNTLTNRETGTNREEFRIEQVIDRASSVASVWLGLTMGCARCHDHKYDPISQTEFYQFFAFFNNANELNIDAPLAGEYGAFLKSRPDYERQRRTLLNEYNVGPLQEEWERTLLKSAGDSSADARWQVQWNNLGLLVDRGQEIVRQHVNHRLPKDRDAVTDYFVAAYGAVVPPEQYEALKFAELREKLAKLANEFPKLTQAQTVIEGDSQRTTCTLIRGDFRRPGKEVRPGFPAALCPTDGSIQQPVGRLSTMSRLDLARWLTSETNPLTARVTVNRLWQEFFARGLVETSSDFGVRGDPPSHPELLDWLAVEFRESGWDVKHMQRLIVTSAVYRQASKATPELQNHDPNNRLLARQSRLRLPAELVRDAALSVSGLLNTAIGGPGVRPALPAGAMGLTAASSVSWEETPGSEQYRRGLYIVFHRSAPYPQLLTFDAPNGLASCARRDRSTTPLQALNLLNDPVFFEAAQALAARIVSEQKGSVEERLDYAAKLCLSRALTTREKELLTGHYQKQCHASASITPDEALIAISAQVGASDPGEFLAWTGVSRVLLNLEEFITRE